MSNKRKLIFNPNINKNTFVFFFLKGEMSWSVRDYSKPGCVTTTYANEFAGWDAARVLREAEHIEDAPVIRKEEIDEWHQLTMKLNRKHGIGIQHMNNNVALNVQLQSNPINAAPPIQVRSSNKNKLRTSRIYIPTNSTDDWKSLLASPTHWRDGYSAKTLAELWQKANGFPTEVTVALNKCSPLNKMELLLAMPEHQTPLPGGGRPTQSDIFVLARTEINLVSIVVEGKVEESFGQTIAEWSKDASQGKIERLQYLIDCIGLQSPIPDSIRYQLLHRTAASVIEARRFHANQAVMIVHSFSRNSTWFSDYKAFLNLYGIQPQIGVCYMLKELSDMKLYSAWVHSVAD